MTNKACPLLLMLGACATAGAPEDVGEATVEIRLAATAIPGDGECAQIVATRLSDFHVTTFRGLLDGAVMKVPSGEHRVTAVAYAQPCNPLPAAQPWAADEQITTFSAGPNVLVLNFKKKVDVEIDANFDEELLVVEVPGSRRRIGRNAEDIAASGIAGQLNTLDGWDVTLVAEPPDGGGGAPGETLVFSTLVPGGTPYSPRGMARRTTGDFFFQVSEVQTPVAWFDGLGGLVRSLPVVYPPGSLLWDFTDGIDAIDATRFVRTAFSNAGFACDETGCTHSGLDILELKGAPGSEYLEVVDQIVFSEQAGMPLHQEYPLGVTASGGNFIVSFLPDGFTVGSSSRLVTVDADGNLVAGPAMVPGSNEGVTVDGDGRLMAMTYEGIVTAHDAADLAPRAGETLDYTIAPNVTNARSLAWDDQGDQFVLLDLDGRVRLADADLATAPTAFVPSGYDAVSWMDCAGGQIALVDRFPGTDGTALPVIDRYSLTGALVSQLTLTGVATPLRPMTFATLPSGGVVIHYRRPGDPSVNTVAYVHDAAGGLVGQIDLGQYGFRLITGVNYLPFTDELAFTAIDTSDVARIVVTDLAGAPRRSYRADSLGGGLGDFARITTGPHAGLDAMILNQPTHFFRLDPL